MSKMVWIEKLSFNSRSLESFMFDIDNSYVFKYLAMQISLCFCTQFQKENVPANPSNQKQMKYRSFVWLKVKRIRGSQAHVALNCMIFLFKEIEQSSEFWEHFLMFWLASKTLEYCSENLLNPFQIK